METVEEEESLEKDLSTQSAEHLMFLQRLGFIPLGQLIIGEWVKCLGGDEQRPSGAYAYKTWANELQAGGVGLLTRAKVHGAEHEFRTLPGIPQGGSSFSRLSPLLQETAAAIPSAEQTVAELSYIHNFWGRSMPRGTSEYLEAKGVGAYGVRFRQSSEFGRAAVVPVKDLAGNLKGLQLLNGNGKPKQMLKGSKVTANCYHIGKIDPVGTLLLCEGYATGAFLYELLSAVPVCVCFSSCNLAPVAVALRDKYPVLRIIVTGDNDRHLPRNEGVEAARAAAAAVGGKTAIPDFGAIPPGKDATDWLDLGRMLGAATAIAQLNKIYGL